MENYEMQYPVNGSTALKPQVEESPDSCEHIIIVPDWTPQKAPSGTIEEALEPAQHVSKPHHALRTTIPRHETKRPNTTLVTLTSAALKRFEESKLMQTEMVQSLRYGNVKGVSFDCLKPWQTVVVGCVFSAVAFAALFFGC